MTPYPTAAAYGFRPTRCGCGRALLVEDCRHVTPPTGGIVPTPWMIALAACGRARCSGWVLERQGDQPDASAITLRERFNRSRRDD